MKHNPREDIKGDSQVMARGADVLFMRDLRAQVTLLMAKLTESPKFAPWLKEKELLEEIARSGYINPTRVIKTEDQYKRDAQAAAQSSPPDPRIVAEELRLKGKAMQVADQKEQRQVDVALAQNSDKLRVAELMQKRDEAFARLAADQKMSVAQLLQQWKIALVDVDAENQRFNAEAQLRRDTGEGI
jgi:prophage antirepressor-like protein